MENEILTLDEFAEYVKNNILKCMDETYADAEPALKQSQKPGGVTLTGLELVRPGNKTTSVFYLEPEYEKYLRGDDIDYLMKRIAQKYVSLDLHMPDLYIKPVFDWNYSKSRVVFSLVSIDKAKRELQFSTCPIIKLPYTNIGIMFYLDITSDDGKNVTSVPVGHNMVNKWRIDLKELYDTAKNNTPSIRKKDVFLSNADMEEMSDFCPMYIATNKNHFYGAASILYPDVYKVICEYIGDDIYILPTSVHECSCVPRSKVSIYEMRRVLEAINRIHPDDYLSNQVLVMENGRLVKAHK